MVAGHKHARRWLQFTANIGRAPNTIDAYGRALEDHNAEETTSSLVVPGQQACT